ncbi:hypothetical protein AVEN_271914-1 [Araneus ventricosus]|uniref:Uncharacterized protein n=1 Tax=Araneus ventricosus TaxID=182803 RepID=A0A4Y2CB79_ARAVE|nr:hypothetical protein AVEN_271914-1 [Araneus ventricosus]
MFLRRLFVAADYFASLHHFAAKRNNHAVQLLLFHLFTSLFLPSMFSFLPPNLLISQEEIECERIRFQLLGKAVEEKKCTRLTTVFAGIKLLYGFMVGNAGYL